MKKDIFIGTAAVVISCLGLGVNLNSCRRIERIEEERENKTKVYEDFQQNVDFPLPLNDDETIQIDSHLGYQLDNVVSRIDDGLYIKFVNNTDVVAAVRKFGEPIQPQEEVQDGVFLPYQHILIVPEDNYDAFNNPQEYDGYESNGFDHVVDGVLSYYTIYTNTETVKCTNYTVEDGKTKSLEFGTLVEKAKVLRKEQ